MANLASGAVGLELQAKAGQSRASKPASGCPRGEAGYLSTNNSRLLLAVCMCHIGVAAFQDDRREWSCLEEQLDPQGLLHK